MNKFNFTISFYDTIPASKNLEITNFKNTVRDTNQTNKNKISDELIEKFISNPESFVLYRGERETNKNGLHFTTNKEWAKHFGKNTVKGTLPVGSKMKILTEEDMETALNQNFVSERQLWDSIFAKGYDAILGTDSMNNEVLDVIVNPKHLGRFMRRNPK